MTETVDDLLARLVAFPTVSDRPVDGIAAFVAERCEAAGFRVERFDGREACAADLSGGPPRAQRLSGNFAASPLTRPADA